LDRSIPSLYLFFSFGEKSRQYGQRRYAVAKKINEYVAVHTAFAGGKSASEEADASY